MNQIEHMDFFTFHVRRIQLGDAVDSDRAEDRPVNPAEYGSLTWDQE